MDKRNRRRSANFTQSEDLLIIEITRKFIQILENKQINETTRNQKQEAWKEIAKEFNSKNYGPNRSAVQLKLKYNAIKKKEHKNGDTQIQKEGNKDESSFLEEISESRTYDEVPLVLENLDQNVKEDVKDGEKYQDVMSQIKTYDEVHLVDECKNLEPSIEEVKNETKKEEVTEDQMVPKVPTVRKIQHRKRNAIKIKHLKLQTQILELQKQELHWRTKIAFIEFKEKQALYRQRVRLAHKLVVTGSSVARIVSDAISYVWANGKQQVLKFFKESGESNFPKDR